MRKVFVVDSYGDVDIYDAEELPEMIEITTVRAAIVIAAGVAFLVGLIIGTGDDE